MTPENGRRSIAGCNAGERLLFLGSRSTPPNSIPELASRTGNAACDARRIARAQASALIAIIQSQVHAHDHTAAHGNVIALRLVW
jgi:hypothetical protein